MEIFLATDAEHRGLTADDRILATALEARGAEVTPLVWNEPMPTQLGRGSVVLIRSCWEYHLQHEAFVRWIGALEASGARVVNDPRLLRWNLHKRYLLDLEARGVAIVPTALVPRGDAPSLHAILELSDWPDAVVKPAVSLSAHETWRTSLVSADQARFAAMCDRGDVLVQRFVPEIESGGEWSLVFLGGDYSHAVRKRPRPGDFRVQLDHGGSVAPAEPSHPLVDDARRVIAALPTPALYARIDGVEVDGRLVLMEAECIDPVLYFRFAPAAAEAFADTLVAHAQG